MREINHQSELQFGGQKERTATDQTMLNLANETKQNWRRLSRQTKMFQQQKWKKNGKKSQAY